MAPQTDSFPRTGTSIHSRHLMFVSWGAKPHMWHPFVPSGTLMAPIFFSVQGPVPKSSQPKVCADFRPISVTSILCRLLEKLIITKFVCPVLTHTDCNSLFRDQFAFGPTGSTTAALINLLHTITLLLQNHDYVHLIGLDFSKAFDSVRHFTLIQKLSEFPIPSCAHNWMIEYLDTR